MILHQEFIKEYKIKVAALPEGIQKAVSLYEELKGQIKESIKGSLIDLSTLGKDAKEAAKTSLEKPISAYSQKVAFGSLTLDEAINGQYFFWKEEINLFGAATYHLGYTRFDSITIPKTVFDIVKLPFRHEYQGDFKTLPNQANLKAQLQKADENLVLKMLQFLKEQTDLKPYLDLGADKYEIYFQRFSLLNKNRPHWEYSTSKSSYTYFELDNADSTIYSYGMIAYQQLEGEEEIKFRINETAKKLEPITWTNYRKIAKKYRNWKDKNPMGGKKDETENIESIFEKWLSKMEALKLRDFNVMIKMELA